MFMLNICLPVALTEHPQPLSIWNSSTDKSLYTLRVNVSHFLFQQHGKGENAGEEDKHPAPSVLSTAVHHILTLTSRINNRGHWSQKAVSPGTLYYLSVCEYILWRPNDMGSFSQNPLMLISDERPPTGLKL